MKIELLISGHCSGTYPSVSKITYLNFDCNFQKLQLLISIFHRRLYKIRQRKAIYSEVTKVDLVPFGNKLFIYFAGKSCPLTLARIPISNGAKESFFSGCWFFFTLPLYRYLLVIICLKKDINET